MALYNKYRPKTLSEACGQDHVKMCLTNQIKNNDLVHAYLFLGPAGTGKTTVARIFAAMINCSTGPTETPPSDDRFASQILAGKSGTDVVELDGASNNGVDHVRDLRQKACYGPIEMKKKIYIIDECHMLSPQAWNALLKIIEEPPEYVIFIFCTTDATKVPATVLTRVQTINFKPLSADLVMDTTRKVCAAEGIEIDDDAVRLIATTAQGSMRMALTNLEQLKHSGKITSDLVSDIVGFPSRSHVRDFINAILNLKFSEAMMSSSQVIGKGVPPKKFLEEAANYCHDILVCNVYDMAASGFTKDEVEDVRKTRDVLEKKLQDFRTFVPKLVSIIQKYHDFTIYNVQPQSQINMASVEMYNLYRLAPKKEATG